MPIPSPLRHRPLHVALLLALALPALAAAAATPPSARRPGHPSAPARRPVATAPAARAPRAGVLERDTLAWVGERAITAADLVERIEMMPWAEKRAGAPMDSAKVRALQSLAAEALLAQEAERQGLGDTGGIARMRQALRRALARDALYHDVVATAADPPTAEVDRLVRARAARLAPAGRRALRHSVIDSLRAPGEQERAVDFMHRTLAAQRAVVDSATFVMLADSLHVLMLAHPMSRSDTAAATLPPEFVDLLLARLAPALDRPLVQLADGPLRLGDALEAIRFQVFALHVHGRRRFAAELSGHLRTLVEGEVMAREALRRRLDQRPAVQRDLDLWSAAWRAHLLLAHVAAGAPASDDDAFRRFALEEPERARATCEVDVEEVLSPSREQARSVRARLDAGADPDSLARAVDPRRPSGARSGFFPVSRRPQLGFAALLTPLDSLSGPMSLPEGFTVFRVRGKRLLPDSVAAVALLERARDDAAVEARANRVAHVVAALAERGRVELDYATLPRIQVAAIEVLTRRSLGFGGGMLAVPTLTPLWDWVPIWRASRTVMP